MIRFPGADQAWRLETSTASNDALISGASRQLPPSDGAAGQSKSEGIPGDWGPSRSRLPSISEVGR